MSKILQELCDFHYISSEIKRYGKIFENENVSAEIHRCIWDILTIPVGSVSTYLKFNLLEFITTDMKL